jgi:hypothetical protein
MIMIIMMGHECKAGGGGVLGGGRTVGRGTSRKGEGEKRVQGVKSI